MLQCYDLYVVYYFLYMFTQLKEFLRGHFTLNFFMFFFVCLR